MKALVLAAQAILFAILATSGTEIGRLPLVGRIPGPEGPVFPPQRRAPTCSNSANKGVGACTPIRLLPAVIVEPALFSPLGSRIFTQAEALPTNPAAVLSVDPLESRAPAQAASAASGRCSR